MKGIVIGGSKGLGSVFCNMAVERGDSVFSVSRSVTECDLPLLTQMSFDIFDKSSWQDLTTELEGNWFDFDYLVFCHRNRNEATLDNEMLANVEFVKHVIDYLVNSSKLAPKTRAVIGVSSVFDRFVGKSQGFEYRLGKVSLVSLFQHLAVTSGPDWRFNTISPMTFLKPESRDFHLENTKKMEFYKNIVPVQRLAEADEISNLMYFLASRGCDYLNGVNIPVDGGASLVWSESWLGQDFRCE